MLTHGLSDQGANGLPRLSPPYKGRVSEWARRLLMGPPLRQCYDELGCLPYAERTLEDVGEFSDTST